jgi:hypothetical protein
MNLDTSGIYSDFGIPIGFICSLDDWYVMSRNVIIVIVFVSSAE